MNIKRERILKSLVGRGFHLFPIKRDTKRPAIKNMLEEASLDIEQLKEWEKKFPGCNWGVSLAKSKLVAVDVDWNYGGLEAWKALVENKGEPKTLKQISGSGALHYIFKADKSKRYVGGIMKGIDVKYNGYIVVYPSIHESTGKLYKFESWKQKINSAPDWLKELIEKQVRLKTSDEPGYRFGKDYLNRLVDELIKFEYSYSEWVQVGMALHAADDSVDGLALYIKFTTENESYVPGDEEKAADKWDSFNSDDREDAITSLTLGYMIRKKGGAVPNPHYQEDLEIFKQGKLEVTTKEEAEEGWLVDRKNKKFSRNQEWILKHFEDQGFAIYAGNGKDPIVKITNPGRGRIEVDCQPLSKLNVDYADRAFRYTQFTSTGIKDVDVPAYKCWMEDSRRTYFTKIIFDPSKNKTEKGILNLFDNIPCEARPGGVTYLLKILKASLCGGNEKSFGWLMDFLAHLVQKPEEKPTVVPVIIGRQGTGKGLLTEHLMARILGDLFFKIATSDRVMARFNMAQANRLLTNIDEATWRGNKSEDGFLKNLTGSEFLEVEEKFGLTLRLPNFSRYIITSNNQEAVGIEAGNRRYVVIEGSDEFAGDTKVFQPIFTALRQGGLYREFFGFLQKRDISNFDPFKVPSWDRGGEIAKIKTSGPIIEFWYDLLLENPQPIFDISAGVSQKLAFEKFLEFTKETKSYQKGISRREFWRITQDKINGFPRSSTVRSGGRFRYVKPYEILVGLCESLKLDVPEDWRDEGFYYDVEFEDDNFNITDDDF